MAQTRALAPPCVGEVCLVPLATQVLGPLLCTTGEAHDLAKLAAIGNTVGGPLLSRSGKARAETQRTWGKVNFSCGGLCRAAARPGSAQSHARWGACASTVTPGEEDAVPSAAPVCVPVLLFRSGLGGCRNHDRLRRWDERG